MISTRIFNRFVILSLCMHGALLAQWRLHAPELQTTDRSLAVDLVHNVDNYQDTPSAHTTLHTARRLAAEMRPAQHRRSATARGKSAVPTQSPLKKNPPAALATAAAAPPAPAAGGRPPDSDAQSTAVTRATSATSSEASIRARIQARLVKALHANFSYPLLARRKGWQGLVKLQLRIEPDGRLSHIELIGSSGYAVLDKAALDSTYRIQAVSEAATWLHNTALEVQLPVEYRLVNG